MDRQPEGQSSDLVKQTIQFLENMLLDVTQIQGDVQVRLHLRNRSMRHTQKIGEVLVGVTAEPLGDICHYRNACALNLIPESKILRKPFGSSDVIDSTRKSSRFLPCLNVLESFECCHFAPFRGYGQ